MTHPITAEQAAALRKLAARAAFIFSIDVEDDGSLLVNWGSTNHTTYSGDRQSQILPDGTEL